MGFYDDVVFGNYLYLLTYLLNINKSKNYKLKKYWALYIYHKISQINNFRLSNTENAINVQFSLILIGRRVWYLLHSIILHTHTHTRLINTKTN